MVGVEQFVGDLQKFFKDVRKFLDENLKDYSLGLEDDEETERLLKVIERLNEEAGTLVQQEELYDDNVLPVNEVQEMKRAKAAVPPSCGEETGGIMEDTYDDPYATKSEVAKADEGIKEEMYEDPNSTKDAPTNPSKQEDEEIKEETYENPYATKDVPNKTEEEGIMEETYEDPNAASGEAKDKEAAEEGGEMDDVYENPYADRQIVQQNQDKKATPEAVMADKKGKKDKKEKKKDKKGTEDNVSNRSDESNEGSGLPNTAADLQDSGIQGPLKKQSGKSRNILKDKNYWCAIKEGVMYYFEVKTKKHKGHIAIKDFKASETDKKFVFQLVCPGRKTMFFCAVNEKDMHQWITYINTGKLPEEGEGVGANQESPRGKAAPPPATEVTEEVVEDSGDLYELEEPKTPTRPQKEAGEGEETGTFDELYEDPGDYQSHQVQRAEAVPEVAVDEEFYDDTVTVDRPQPPLPPRNEDPGDKPPPPPARDTPQMCRQRPPIDPPLPPPPDNSQDVYDDTATPMVIVDEEVYDDGTSAPPPDNSSLLRKKPTPSTSSGTQQPPCKEASPDLPPPPTPDFEAMYYGLWGCEGVGEYELDFPRGACIEVVNKEKYGATGWWVGRLNKKVGLVPKDFLYPMYKQV